MTVEEDLVMIIDKPHFKVKLHKSYLEVDLKEGIRKELEDALEAQPAIRDTLGFLFQTVIPLDVSLADIESVKVDRKGQLEIVTPNRRNLHIPLDPRDSKRLTVKLNELIAIEKERALKQKQEAEKVRLAEEDERAETLAEQRRGNFTEYDQSESNRNNRL